MRIDLDEAFAAVTAPWTPLIVGELNGQHVKVAVLDGTFVWHHHEQADELFYVLDGTLRLRFADRPDLTLGPGQLAIVPRGVEHCPQTVDGPVRVLLFEPAGTVNTGTAGGERTVAPRHLGAPQVGD